MSTVPAVWAGEHAMSLVPFLFECTRVAGSDPKWTAVTSLNRVPMILTLVPPPPGPWLGEIDVMIGATFTIVQVKLVEPESAGMARSVAVTVTEYVPADVGVPVMLAVAGSMESPGGSPVAVHCRTGLGEAV